MPEIVSKKELATLSDRKLVALIEKRSSLSGEAAREALALFRTGQGDVVRAS